MLAVAPSRHPTQVPPPTWRAGNRAHPERAAPGGGTDRGRRLRHEFVAG